MLVYLIFLLSQKCQPQEAILQADRSSDSNVEETIVLMRFV
jgi:hypothetical protein